MPRFTTSLHLFRGICAVFLAVPVYAQHPERAPVVQLVKDINPRLSGSDPANFVTLHGIAYFRANDGEHGFELWRSDGTTAGTTLVIDLNPGLPNGFPDSITSVNGKLYFNGFDNPEFLGSEVWKSDGSATGTILLADTFPSLQGGGTFGPQLPGYFTALDRETVVFTALDPEGGIEPWETDGTPQGTRRIIDLHPGQQDSIPIGLTRLRDVIYFGADDSSIPGGGGTTIFDRELFRTDGTAEGTYRVKDINPGPYPSTPTDFIKYRHLVFFRADDGIHGAELWRTDGTGSGTTLVADLNPGPTGSLPEYPMVAHFRAADGAQEKSLLVFDADDGTHGFELFRSDGTERGTNLIKDINPSGDSFPLGETNFAGRVYFSADDGVHGNELWVTDGTNEGTRLLADLNPGVLRSSPQEFTVALQRLFFVAIVPDDAHFTVKTQLWVTDGTSAGTKLVFQEPGFSYGYSIGNLTPLRSKLLFTAPRGVDANGLSNDVELFSVSLE